MGVENILKQKIFAIGLVFVLLFTTSVAALADSGSTKEELLNRIELSPQSAASPELDAYLDELLPTIITDDMDTYTKLQACYDYIIANTTYASHLAYSGTLVNGVTCRTIYSSYGEIEGYGATALAAGKGMCNAYASAWILMARKIGVDATLVEGTTKRAKGGYSYHKWAEVTLDGVTYTVDPQLEQCLRPSRSDAYSAFFVTYADCAGRYNKY